MKVCRKHGYKKYRVLIEADKEKNGMAMATILKTAYGASDIADYSGGYEDFSLVFDHVWRRDEVVQQINKEVSDYRAAHPDALPSDPQPAPETPTPEKPTTAPDEEGKPATDWTTYIIIGAAAVLIVLLLFSKKKKKG